MRVLQLIALVAVSWYGMMAVHEGGHCIGAWLSGGSIERVEIPLLGFSRTEYRDNPNPLLAAWAGPSTAALVALGMLGIATFQRGHTRQGLLFFAGFSLTANGMYIGLGGFDRVGDCADLLNHGAQLWHLVAFGITSTALGLFCWHRLGPIRKWLLPVHKFAHTTLDGGISDE